MNTLITPLALADKIIAEAKLPTDGKNTLPLNAEYVSALIARAVTEDRNSGPPDFNAIADKVLASYSHGETLMAARHSVLAALRYAQSSGARFKAPSETDYADAVGDAVEAFCATMKNKGFMQ